MLFFLYGEDLWRKEQRIKALIDRFAREVDSTRMNIKRMDISGLEEDTLQAALRASPFLARKRMLILKNVVTQGRKDLVELLENTLPALGESTVLVISEDKSKPKKPKEWKNQSAKKIWEDLERNAKCEAFPELTGLRLEKEIQAQAKTHGLTFEKEAAAMLAILSGGDLGWVAKEMEKLTAYKGGHPEQSEGSRDVTLTVTTKDIKLLCTAQGEANIFEFLDALAVKNRATLLRTAQEELRESDPLHLIYRASGHLRAMLTMSLAGSQEGAQALKLHPFQAKKISAQLYRWKVTELKQFLFKLMLLEYAVKTGRAADPKVQLTALLAQV